MSGFSPLDSDRLGDRVAADLRRAILTGEIRPGERLLEQELAEQMGISRGPVRDALQMLSHKGLVVTYPRRGTFVYQLSKGEAVELLRFRAALEGEAARLLVEHGRRSSLDDLEGVVEQMERLSATDSMERPRDLDIEFHRTIMEASQNRWIHRAWSDLHPFVWLLIGPVRVTAEEHPLFGERHRRVLTALRTGSADTAEAAIRDHILGSLSKLPVVQSWPAEEPDGPVAGD